MRGTAYKRETQGRNGTSQITPIRQANVGPNLGSTSAVQRWPNIDVSDGPTSLMSAQRWFDVEPMLAQHRPNVGATMGSCFFANKLPTFWSTFCQHSANHSPSCSYWYFHIKFTMIDIIFLKMPRKCHISRHVLVWLIDWVEFNVLWAR